MSYKVSIVIPVYNAEEFIIDRTLKSIEEQTMDFNDIEVVLVNDCSTDNTEELINNYAKEHENIVPINLRENAGGPAIPRNIGISYASADYLMFLDQDDTFRRNACEVLYNKITSEDVDVVCGNYTLVDEKTGKSQICFEYPWVEEDEVRIENINDHPEFLNIGVIVWCKIFRRSFVLENHLQFVDCVGEDLYFSVRALLHANGIVLLKNFIVVDYLIRSASLSHQIDKDYLLEYTDIYLGLFDYCEQNIADSHFQPLFNSRMHSLLSNLFYSDLYYDELTEVFIKINELYKKLETKSFKFDDSKNQLLFSTVVNDEYPFDNSISVYSILKSNRQKRLDVSKKYLDQEAKLYIDRGNGFNEKDCITQYYKLSEENEILFDLSEFNNISRLRFDPITWFFVKCEMIEIESGKGELFIDDNNSITPTAKVNKFLTYDPQYYIFEEDLNDLEYIKFNFNITFINNAETTNEINKLING